MMLRDAFDTCRGVLPPLLRQQKALIHRVEWPLLLAVSSKPLVVRDGIGAADGFRIRARPHTIFDVATYLLCRVFCKLELFVGREEEVLKPIGVS